MQEDEAQGRSRQVTEEFKQVSGGPVEFIDPYIYMSMESELGCIVKVKTHFGPHKPF